ncbi:MAG TPA: sigma-54 dependent transcriptional regulator [Lentimicrobium sp.]|nr:sigma-54 dependent transcriptional regulator [Lentimicrobium sp.]
MHKILIIDDDVTFCLMLETFLNKHGYKVQQSFSFKEATKQLTAFKPDIVLTDLRLPDNDGLEVLRAVIRVNPQTPVILMTGYADIRTAVQAMKMGAFDYVAKPVNPDEILLTIRRALNPVNNAHTAEPNIEKHPFFVEGFSTAARKISEYVSLVAPTNMSVLIMGESGTGKEFIARKIHMGSQRKDNTFIAIDCGALPRDLAGSELFGHLKGSFTGAFTDKQGQFEAANGGTIFLDEIGNLSYEIQVQLLRAIQERKIRRIGSTTEISIDVRIITATNEDLKQSVAKGDFREDLYHRINEFAIHVAPLRQRPEDLVLFAKHFLQQANDDLNRNVEFFEDEVLDIFSRYSWPGNFREFKNIIKRAVLLTKGDTIFKETLPEEMITEALQVSPNSNNSMMISNNSFHHVSPPFQPVELKDAAHRSERDLIINTLEKVRFNKSKAAKMLNVDRKTLYNKMRLYNIPLQ